jgi:predicted nucleic acid-binding protein
LAVYDWVYVALAERLGCPLISIDAPQVRAAQTESVVLKPLTDFKP